ncbi:MAG: hypothetical protein H6640_18940 [Caldilineaceae bacterium]|nr:hypothetical protein [Caldilineaceae bacterium]
MPDFVQWKAYIGPQFRRVSDAGWDYSRTADFAFADTVGAVAATIASGQTTNASISGFTGNGVAGGIWVGPNGASQGWEYINYSGRAGDVYVYLTRESAATREHNGVHTAGAQARMWYPITTDDGRLHIIEESDANLSTVFWRAELSGVKAPRSFLRNGHAVLVKVRYSVTGSWENLLLGWIDGFSVDDDYQRLARWKIDLVSIHGMLAKVGQETIIAGDRNIARHGRIVKQDHPLSFPHKEFASGDALSAESDTSAKSAIDGDENTVWIADRLMGVQPEYDYSNWTPRFIATRIYLKPAAGLGQGYRFIEFTGGQWAADNAIGDCLLITKNGTSGVVARLTSTNEYGEHVVICENANKFLSMEPCQDASKICEVGAAFFDFIDANMDCIALWSGSGWDSGAVAWGPTNWEHPGAIYDPGPGQPTQEKYWPGSIPIPPPQQGEVIRWIGKQASNDPKDYFVVDSLSAAGYDYSRGRDENYFFPFFLLQLPGINLALPAGLTPSYTGNIQPWNGAASSTNGLPASGVIQIGGEQMAFTKVDATTINITARAQNGTAADDHFEGDLIYVVDGSMATDAFLCNEIAWSHVGSAVHPAHFKVWGTASITQPRYPLEDDNENPMAQYGNDYTLLTEVNGHAASTWSMTLAPAKRLNWVLFEGLRTTADPGRIRLSEFEVRVDPSTHDASTWLTGTINIADLFQRILINAGLYSGAYTIVEPLAVEDAFETTTEPRDAWAVLQDLADYVAARVVVDFLSHITISDNPMWRLDGTQTPAYSWYRSNAAAVQFLAEGTGAVSQLRMKWLHADGEVAGTVVYPATPTGIGKVETLADAIYPSEALALLALQRRYMVSRNPFSLVVQPAQSDTGIHPAQFHAVSWDFDDSTATRTGMVISVDHVLDRNHWQQAIRMVQLREDVF